MAGYSKRSLVEKLGIKPGHKVYLGNPPSDYRKTLGSLPEDATLLKVLKGPCGFIQFFTKGKAELESTFPKLKKNLEQEGSLWISWPKGASKIKTDLNENVVRDIGLRHGLVDIKICAIDDIWSGLKFVVRLKDRK
ncbi:MAG: DUF3052 domain-containing protein [Candidatus Angelobacter sp. Gp1-AA117]|nr:MAG: DUF3052 domain-containing protein [Candidatus Angelobacter sp. Gp1-AA117]